MRWSGQAPGSETDETRERRVGKGERNRPQNRDGGSCQRGVIVWRQTDSIVNVELEQATQYHAQGADIGLGMYSNRQEAHRRDAQSPKDVFTSQDALLETGCS